MASDLQNKMSWLTKNKNGNVNLSPFSYFNVFSAAPPILVFSPANRVTDNSRKDTYSAKRSGKSLYDLGFVL